MKVLVVEDCPKIKEEIIDHWLESLGHVSDWAQCQQEANRLLADNEYDLILLDLQIPSRPGGKDVPEFGKQLLKQIRARKGRDVPVILITGQYQHCVDLMTDLQEIGINGSIAKPFPTSGRTLAVVIEEVLEKHRRFRVAGGNRGGPGGRGSNGNGHDEALTPFPGGVLAYYPDHIDLCGVTISEKSHKGYAWQILQALGQDDDRGKRVHLQSNALARRLKPQPRQNTLFRAISTLRDRMEKAMKRCGKACGHEDVIARDEGGYYLADGIVIEVYDENGTLVGAAGEVSHTAPRPKPTPAPPRFNDKQRWVMARLASEGKLTRRDVEQEFSISPRTAKRVLGEMSDAGLIAFDRAEHPGVYRLR